MLLLCAGRVKIETMSDKELIEKYYGVENLPYKDLHCNYPFDTEWNWIMPVVEKIQSKWVNTELRTWHIYTGDVRAMLSYGDKYKGAIGEDKKLVTAIFKAVVEFLRENVR